MSDGWCYEVIQSYTRWGVNYIPTGWQRQDREAMTSVWQGLTLYQGRLPKYTKSV